MKYPKTTTAWFPCYMVVVGAALVWSLGLAAPIGLSAQTGAPQAVKATEGTAIKPQIVEFQWSSKMPQLSPERRAWLEEATRGVNRPRPRR